MIHLHAIIKLSFRISFTSISSDKLDTSILEPIWMFFAEISLTCFNQLFNMLDTNHLSFWSHLHIQFIRIQAFSFNRWCSLTISAMHAVRYPEPEPTSNAVYRKRHQHLVHSSYWDLLFTSHSRLKILFHHIQCISMHMSIQSTMCQWKSNYSFILVNIRSRDSSAITNRLWFIQIGTTWSIITPLPKHQPSINNQVLQVYLPVNLVHGIHNSLLCNDAGLFQVLD